jgi:hypothetical protein
MTVAMHMAALEGSLVGPRRIRRSMIAEARAGLWDAVAAYRGGGVPPDRAEELAIRDFGTVGEVAPSYQAELTARQGRGAAALYAIVFPSMLFGWDLLWSTGAVTWPRGSAPHLVAALASVQDVVTVIVAAAALTLLAITFRSTVSPHRLTVAIGLTGAIGAPLCGAISIAMNLVAGRSTATLIRDSPPAAVAFAGSAAVLVLLIWKSVRTLRVARASLTS